MFLMFTSIIYLTEGQEIKVSKINGGLGELNRNFTCEKIHKDFSWYMPSACPKEVNFRLY